MNHNQNEESTDSDNQEINEEIEHQEEMEVGAPEDGLAKTTVQQEPINEKEDKLKPEDAPLPGDVFIYNPPATIFQDLLWNEDWQACYVGFIGFIIAALIATESNYSIPKLIIWKDEPWFAFSWVIIVELIILFVIMICLLAASFHFMRKDGKQIPFKLGGFIVIYMIAIVAKILGSQSDLKSIGFGDSVWAIVLGFIIVNITQLIKRTTPVLPPWLSNVLKTEYYIKIGVVMLAVQMTGIAKYGLPGLAVAWIDTPIVLVVTFLIGVYIVRLSKADSLVMSAGLSVCGSSAAASVTSIIGGKPATSSLVIAIMSFFAIPQIPLIPLFLHQTNTAPEVGGAFIGGVVDSTGAVIATATISGTDVVTVAAIIKMTQNLLIGPICLVITAIWFRTIKPMDLYTRFPKFVLGFIIVSIVVSFAVVDETQRAAEWFSLIGFVCIGLEMNVKTLAKQIKAGNWRLIVLYVIGQTIDLFTTYGWSYGFMRSTEGGSDDLSADDSSK